MKGLAFPQVMSAAALVSAVVPAVAAGAGLDGRLLWKGTIRDGKLDATAAAISGGKAPVQNWVVAGEKR